VTFEAQLTLMVVISTNTSETIAMIMLTPRGTQYRGNSRQLPCGLTKEEDSSQGVKDTHRNGFALLFDASSMEVTKW
jgi:hypothetical protein